MKIEARNVQVYRGRLSFTSVKTGKQYVVSGKELSGILADIDTAVEPVLGKRWTSQEAARSVRGQDGFHSTEDGPSIR